MLVVNEPRRDLQQLRELHALVSRGDLVLPNLDREVVVHLLVRRFGPRIKRD